MVNLFLNYNWGKTEINHRVIKNLHESVDIESIGATAVGRKSYEYLSQQSDIEYDPLYCIQDIHEEIVKDPYDPARIDELEQQFGVPFLWPAILADRKYIDYTPDKQKRLIQGWFDFYIDVFEAFQPDLYITPAVDSAYTWIPFRIINEDYGAAVQKGHTRVRDRKALQKTVYDDFETVCDRYEQIKSDGDAESCYPESYQNAVDFLNEFRSSGLSPGYTDNTSSSTSQSIIKKTVTYWYQKNFGYYKSDFYHDSTRDRIKTSMKWLFWKWRLGQQDIFHEPNYKEKYVYFPLHMQPEASTMVKSPMYMNLPDVIRNISKSLPMNYQLYVKEHPSLFKYKVRPVDYYTEINELPNTTLIHPSIDSHSLIKNAGVVTTVTGTAGLEGVLYKKPVVTFGNPDYDKLSQVYAAGDRDELPSVLSRAINDHVHTEYHENNLIQYLTAVFEESYPSTHNKTGTELRTAIEKQCDVLQRDAIPDT